MAPFFVLVLLGHLRLLGIILGPFWREPAEINYQKRPEEPVLEPISDHQTSEFSRRGGPKRNFFAAFYTGVSRPPWLHVLYWFSWAIFGYLESSWGHFGGNQRK